MTTRKKIDCHTHINTEDVRREYFSRTDGYALTMQFLDKFVTETLQDDAEATVAKDARLFLCPCIDIHKDIPPQLAKIEEKLTEFRVVGLKIFLTYQNGRSDDEKMLPIYEFARKHRLTVTYHTGSCSLVLPSDDDLEGSRAIYVERVAEQFPDVNFVVAHMGDPYYDETMRVVHNHKNMFTDFSGAYEPGTPEGADMGWAIATFAHAIDQFPDSYKKILYGTDFCPPINLSALDEYDVTIAKIFQPEQFEDVYYNNALRAFPRLAEFLREEEI